MIENYFPCEKITIVVEIAGKSTLTDSVLAAFGTSGSPIECNLCVLVHG